MSSVYRVPVIPRQHQMVISFSRPFLLRFLYIDSPEGGWIMDIADGVSHVPLVCGIPLVTGHDLLEQYEYIDIGGQMFVVSDGDPDALPTYDNFGIRSFLYFVVP